MAGKQEVPACSTVPSLPSAVAQAAHVWNLGHSAAALKTNETLCSGGQVKVQSGQITTVWATPFFPGNRIAFRFLFRALGCNLTWCAVWKRDKSQREEKNPQVLFNFFVWYRAGNCLKGFGLWQMGGRRRRFSDWTFSKKFQTRHFGIESVLTEGLTTSEGIVLTIEIVWWNIFSHKKIKGKFKFSLFCLSNSVSFENFGKKKKHKHDQTWSALNEKETACAVFSELLPVEFEPTFLLPSWLHLIFLSWQFQEKLSVASGLSDDASRGVRRRCCSTGWSCNCETLQQLDVD